MRLLFVPAILLLVAAGEISPVQIDHPWARATAGNVKTGAVYLTLTDRGAADKLVGAATPVAETADVHETIDDHGVMKMRAIAALPLDPGKPVTLEPGGKHIMLMGLKAPLKAGDKFPLTLRFEHASPVTVTVTVEGTGGELPHMGGMPGMGGMTGMGGMGNRIH